MDEETIKKIEESIKNLESKKSRIYFMVQDTKGNAKAGVRHIYQMALTLKNSGFNTFIIHEKNDYKGVSSWLGEEYMEIPHESIENQDLKISPEDFIVVPEIYGHVLEQLSNLSCGKIVLCQAYDHMLETLSPGTTWSQYGFIKCITTNEEQKTYIENVMKNVSIDVIEPLIPETFKKKKLPSKPIISIHTRDQRDTMKIIKTFYLKYPQYRWITFRDMRGLNQEEFSMYLKDSFVSVWVDDTSGFGTFPIESMICGTPVIGKVPNMKPSWMSDDNGVWTYELNNISDIIAEFIQNWLEDNINEDLYDNGVKTATNFNNVEVFSSKLVEFFNDYLNGRKESFSSQLDKIKVEEEN
jgi:hypothetical protein